MLCGVCQEKIVIKRDLWNLYHRSFDLICEACYQKYPLNLSHSTYPIENDLLHVYRLSNERYPHGDFPYQRFMGWILISLIKRYPDAIILSVEELDQKLYTLLDSLRLGDFVVMTLFENIDIKGEEP